MKKLLLLLFCLNLAQLGFTKAIAQEQIAIQGDFGPSVDVASSVDEDSYAADEEDGPLYGDDDYISDIEQKRSGPTERICQETPKITKENKEVKNVIAIENNALPATEQQITYKQDNPNIEGASPVSNIQTPEPEINIVANPPKRTFAEKLADKRRRLEEQNMNRMATQLERQRLRNEMRLTQQFEQAMQQNINKLNFE